MSDMYQDDIYEQESYPEEAPRRRMSGWLIALIIILVLIVLCCLCGLITLLVAGPAVGNTFSTIIEELVTVTPMP
jgi:hypothetical protein